MMDRLECDRMYVAVVDAGSFAAAARRLGVSSGQASKLISRLEDDLGVQLLKRTTRALSVTEVGQAYYDRIKAVLGEFDAVDAAVRTAAGLPSGRLRITAPVSFGTIQLAPVLLEFAAKYPTIQLDVSFNDRVVNLVDEGFDLAVRIGNPGESSLIARRLCAARIVLVGSGEYLDQRGTPQSPDDLRSHDLIIDNNFREPSHWHFRAPQTGVVLSVPVTGRLCFSSGEACLLAAEQGMGLAYVPSFIAGPSLRQGRVVAVLTDFEVSPMGVFVLYPPARYLALKVRALIDFLADQFPARPTWDLGW